MGLLERLHQRRQGRSGGRVQVFEYSRTYSTVSRDVLWDLIRPAEAALFLDDQCVRAWSELPSGGGGEIQSFVRLVDGAEVTSRIEVLAEEPPAFVRLRALEAEMPTQMTFALDELDSGVRLRHAHGYHVPERLTIVDDTPMREHSEPIFDNLAAELARRNL